MDITIGVQNVGRELVFETDKDGHFALRAVRPVPYPIPSDETAGELIRYMGHHPNRPG